MTTYLLNFTLCSALLLLAYVVLLKNKAMYTFNRFYLLFGIVFSLSVPLISIQQRAATIVEQPYFKAEILDAPATPSTLIPAATTASPERINYLFYLLPCIYILITGLLLLRFVKNLYSIKQTIDKNYSAPYENAKLVLIDQKQTPHTFLKYMFLNRDDYQNGQIDGGVLYHELAHARQLHSFDIIFTELVQAICWFNPFILIYRRYIKLNHEFLADAAVLNTHYDTANYQNLLIHSLSGLNGLGITSQFNYAITKKRLIMMTKTTTTVNAWLSRLAVMPFAIAAFLLFTTKTEAQQPKFALPAAKGKADQLQPKPAPKNSPPGKVQRDFIFAELNYKHTVNGVSPELLAEYKNIADKYEPYFSAALSSHGKNMISADGKIMKVSDEDKARLKEIYGQMSKEQQAQQMVGFMMGNGLILPRAFPTAKQLSVFTDARTYGIWINGKRAANAELEKYTSADFAQVFVSKLYAGAAKDKTYKYQVDLMTVDYYANYRKETLAKTKIARMYCRTPFGAKQTGLMML